MDRHRRRSCEHSGPRVRARRAHLQRMPGLSPSLARWRYAARPSLYASLWPCRVAVRTPVAPDRAITGNHPCLVWQRTRRPRGAVPGQGRNLCQVIAPIRNARTTQPRRHLRIAGRGLRCRPARPLATIAGDGSQASDGRRRGIQLPRPASTRSRSSGRTRRVSKTAATNAATQASLNGTASTTSSGASWPRP